MADEVEIKFALNDVAAMEAALSQLGFRRKTTRTHEINTLFDLPGNTLRQRGELLRLRKYGEEWVLTHKAPGASGKHKTRAELETRLDNGEQMELILRALGFSPTFRYEKFRTEWADDAGHVVLDETPIGNFGEIEGPADWIDRTADALGIRESHYITDSYGQLFAKWKAQKQSPAEEMTFSAIRR
jgi:adenylate cyclase, class 2